MIPRIGSEVIVQYLDGDIDQPIITGMAYNPTKKHAYNLPDNKTRSYWKDKTHKGDGFNEIKFESEKGKEEVYVHAQRDRNEKVNNNHTERVDKNFVQSVGSNKISQIEANKLENVAGNYILSVGSKNEGAFLSKALSVVKASFSGMKGFALSLNGYLPGPGDLTEIVAKNRFEATGLVSAETVGSSKRIQAGSAIDMSSGNLISLESGKTIELISEEILSLSCGASNITLFQDGKISIQGTELDIDISGEIKAKASTIRLN